jgi:hypothetical protein
LNNEMLQDCTTAVEVVRSLDDAELDTGMLAMDPSVPMKAVKTPFRLSKAWFKKIAWAIVFGGLKGGLGKSTSAWLVAVEIAEMTGETVLVVCADPLSQTFSTAYRGVLVQGLQPLFHMIQWPTADGLVKGVRQEMKRVGARHVVIDSGGESPKIFEQACILVGQLADEDENVTSELIIPTAPTVPELWRLQATIDAAARVESLSGYPPAINMLIVKAAHNSRDAWETRKHFAEKGWPTLRTQVPQHAFYARALQTIPQDGGWYGSVLCEIAIHRLAERNAA